MLQGVQSRGGAHPQGLSPEGASSVCSFSPSWSSFAPPFPVSSSFSLPSGDPTRNSVKAAPRPLKSSESSLGPLKGTEGTGSSRRHSAAGLGFGAGLAGATEGAVVSAVSLVYGIFFRPSSVDILGVLLVLHWVVGAQRIVVSATKKFIQLSLMNLFMLSLS